jgi:glycerophosphoryl diester phosphodiesterase
VSMTGSRASLPEIVAHRGNAADYPENTLPALRSALELGVRWVEFDVQLTSDLVPVVLHDATLARTSGIDRSVLEMTAAELAELTANETSRFEGRYRDVGVPTLSQAGDLVRAFPEVQAFVELKRASLRAFGLETVVHRVTEVLGSFASRCVVISFDLAAIHYARQTTGTRIGWVLPAYDSLTAIKCEAMTPDYLFCDVEVLPADGSRLWRGPWTWAIYEITTLTAARAVHDRGAALVETMRVRHLLREFRAARAQED